MALPHDAGTAFTCLGLYERAFRMGTFAFARPRLFLLLQRCFRKALTGGDRGRIAGDMTDKTLTLSSLDNRGMQLLGQLAGGEFGKRAREFGFMRQGLQATPAAELPERFVNAQSIHQVARGHQIENGFSEESGRQGGSILGWPSCPGAAVGQQARLTATSAMTEASNCS